jgi:hypothetical protein
LLPDLKHLCLRYKELKKLLHDVKPGARRTFSWLKHARACVPRALHFGPCLRLTYICMQKRREKRGPYQMSGCVPPFARQLEEGPSRVGLLALVLVFMPFANYQSAI